MADVMLLLLADLLVVGVLAFVFAGSAYNRAFALFVLAGLGALLALLALRRRRRTAPLSG